VQIIDHILDEARYVHSPNQDERPEPFEVSLIVIHGISLPAGHFGGGYVEKLFTNTLDCSCHADLAQLDRVTVSSHVFIRREGQVLQFVPFNMRAWHAGQSSYKGRDACNDYSIGIELEGTDESTYSAAQYEQLGRICRLILSSYPHTSQDRIVGHCHIAPERKTDPGICFDWPGFRALLAQN
jgi:AmpD protein